MTELHTLKDQIDKQMPDLIATLSDLVAIPSVGADPLHAQDLEASAEFVAGAFSALGLSSRVCRSDIEPGRPGAPAVIATSPRDPDRPTVLLYAHHDVQPAGDPSRWQSLPFETRVEGDRIFGRGASDDGAGIVVHLGALEAVKKIDGTWPVNVVVFIEGEEEVGSPSFANFLADHREELRSDVIVVADSNNWTVDIPAITASLRGVVTIDVEVRVLDHSVHSGMFGGPVLDAVTSAARLIASLHDDRGDVAVPGLEGTQRAQVEWTEEDFRRDASVVDGYRLAGSGDLAARVWTMPAIAVIGLDATSVADSANAIIPQCRFRLSVRTVPGSDSAKVAEAVQAHLHAHAPFGCQVRTHVEETGPSYQANIDSPVVSDLRTSLEEAWGTAPVSIGVGGSIPFIAQFESAFPEAEVVVTGIEDPASNAHSENESQSLTILRNATVAEARLLQRLGQLER